MRRRLRWLGIVLSLLLLSGGALVALSDHTPLLNDATVGQNPYPLVLDEQTGRAFVFNRDDGSISTIDTASGALVRTVKAGSGFAWMAIDQRTQRVFVTSDDNTITTLDAASGMILQHVTDTELTPRGIAVDERDNLVVVGHRDTSTVTLLDARRGTILRHVPSCVGPWDLAMSVGAGHVFAQCEGNVTAMLDARTGRVLRAVPAAAGEGILTIDERTNRVVVNFGVGAAMALLDARSGAPVRTLAGIDGSRGFRTVAVDGRSGRIYVALTGPGLSGITTTVSQVTMLDGRTGAVLRQAVVAANPVALAFDARRGRLLVSSVGAMDASDQPTGDGMLSVLDGTSLVTLRRQRVGVTPRDLSIDGRTDHLLIDNETTNLDTYYPVALATRPPDPWWQRLRREVLGTAKHVLPWLPLTVPAPPIPTTRGNVLTVDLGRL